MTGQCPLLEEVSIHFAKVNMQTVFVTSWVHNQFLPWKGVRFTKVNICSVLYVSVYYQLFANLSDHNILSKHQSEIHVLHSAVTAFNQRPVILIQVTLMLFLFLTLRKHFTLPQSIMISYCLLHLYSISGVTHKCFSSYLNNHTQKRLVNGSLSECCTLKCSIPQGTILGPLLFLLYINDLPNCLFHFELIMYVDDFYIPI